MSKNVKTILVVTGLPGSGKSEVSGYIKSLGIPMFRTGDIIREEVVRRGLPLTIENSEMIAKKLREEEGMDVATRRVGEKIKQLNDRLVCVEGPRDMDELAYISTLGRMVLVIIHAPEDMRFRRLMSRGGSRDPKTRKEFGWRDSCELARGLGEVIKTDRYGRHEIENTGDLEDLKSKVRNLLEKIRK